MKREDILAMPAGRELDVLVAEKVMGWEVRGRYFMTPEGIRTHEETSYTGFSPSISISAAWEVVEKFYYSDIRKVNGVKWAAWVGRGNGQSHNATADTAPEAMCKAALLTVLEDRV
jgi:hypothetical protein